MLLFYLVIYTRLAVGTQETDIVLFWKGKKVSCTIVVAVSILSLVLDEAFL